MISSCVNIFLNLIFKYFKFVMYLMKYFCVTTRNMKKDNQKSHQLPQNKTEKFKVNNN